MAWDFHSHEEVAAAGWIFRGERGCKEPACAKRILWYQHSETKKWMPVDPATFQPHWSTCPGAKGFRKTQPERQRYEKESNLF